MTGAGFILDLHRCTGCGACVLACRLEHGWPGDAAWRRLIPLNQRRHPGGPSYVLSVACHHCEEPACLRDCPAGAYEKRPDGIVVHHEERCLGCRYCEMVCPFGAPKYDRSRGVIGKCHLCYERLDGRGAAGTAGAPRPPACVAACPTGALGFRPAGKATEADQVAFVPGFADRAACRPTTRFRLPRARRAALLEALTRALAARSSRP